MIDKITLKRPAVLMALLILGITLMAVNANSAYADVVELPFTDDFGSTSDCPFNSNDVPGWDEIEDKTTIVR